MRVVITGGTGFVGRQLVDRLIEQGHTVHLLLREPRAGLPSGVTYSIWDVLGNEPTPDAVNGADAVVHLAGEPVAQRWTPDVKRRILKSRTVGTQRLIQACSVARVRPQAFVCASAIGYYGNDCGDRLLDEKAPPGSDFLADVCQQWESAAELGAALGMRVAKMRIGLVLGRDGGALDRMVLPFKMGVGGNIGSGEHWMSWIHSRDLVELLITACQDERYRGAVNAVAPAPVRNADFTAALARTLRRPAIFPLPEWVLRTVFGEMSKILLASQRVSPSVALKAGFEFAFTDVAAALADLLKPR